MVSDTGGGEAALLAELFWREILERRMRVACCNPRASWRSSFWHRTDSRANSRLSIHPEAFRENSPRGHSSDIAEKCLYGGQPRVARAHCVGATGFRWLRKSSTTGALRSSMTSWSTERLHRVAENWSNSFIASRYEVLVLGLTPRSTARYRRKNVDNRVASGGTFISGSPPG